MYLEGTTLWKLALYSYSYLQDLHGSLVKLGLEGSRMNVGQTQDSWLSGTCPAAAVQTGALHRGWWQQAAHASWTTCRHQPQSLQPPVLWADLCPLQHQPPFWHTSSAAAHDCDPAGSTPSTAAITGSFAPPQTRETTVFCTQCWFRLPRRNAAQSLPL